MSATPHIRLAEPADARAVAVIHVEGWRAAYTGLMPEAVLAAFSIDEREQTWRDRFAGLDPSEARTMVAVIDGQVLGWASTGPCRDDDREGGDGELWALYIDPASWGRGIGRALFAAAAADLRAHGHRALTLWVLDGNARARRFYEAAGMHADGAHKDEEIQGAHLPHVRYRLPLHPSQP
ncbi:MAG: GNAT family N-acetyltransferase [Minicystis sp.]